MEKMISVECVSKRVGEARLLSGINLELYGGQVCGIVGRNGSGKSVLLKCICGFMSVTEGEIRQGTKRIGTDIPFIEDTGFIIEAPAFLPGKSGFRNLEYLARIRRKIGPDRIRECMALVGLSPDDRKPVRKYSLGMRQRLGIAQAIMEYPSVIILDEPMNGLDNKGVREMRDLFLGLKAQGCTILLATHSSDDVRELCDRVWEMDQGILSERETDCPR